MIYYNIHTLPHTYFLLKDAVAALLMAKSWPNSKNLPLSWDTEEEENIVIQRRAVWAWRWPTRLCDQPVWVYIQSHSIQVH